MTKNRTLDEVLSELPARRRARVERRGKALIKEEYTLRRLREARKLTQHQLAEMSGKAQANIVRLEKQADLLISTLREHVEAMGGKLELRVKFPDSDPLLLSNFADEAGANRGPSKGKPSRKRAS